MAIQLQLESGEVRNYPTFYTISRDEYSEERKCECKEKIGAPNTGTADECSHISCAKTAARKDTNRNKHFALVFLSGIVWWPIVGWLIGGFSTALLTGEIMGGSYILIGAYFAWKWHGYSKNFEDLVEFSDNGTIGGVKAHLI